MTGVSMKQPFQSGYLMDISRCIERLEIALLSQSVTLTATAEKSAAFLCHDCLYLL
jgi:hypothetical protein